MILRKALTSGEWPNAWKIHNIVPLYKKKFPGNPENYRGVHIASILCRLASRYLDNTSAAISKAQAPTDKANELSGRNIQHVTLSLSACCNGYLQ